MSRKLTPCDHDERPPSHCKQPGSLDASAGSVLVVDILNTALGRFEAALRDARIEGSAYGRYPDEWEELINATKALMHHPTLPIVVTPNKVSATDSL